MNWENRFIVVAFSDKNVRKSGSIRYKKTFNKRVAVISPWGTTPACIIEIAERQER